MRIFLSALLTLAVSAQSAGIFDSPEKRSPPAYVANSMPWPWTHGPGELTVSAQADLSKVVGKLTKYNFGNNTSWWSRSDWNLDPDRVAKAVQGGMSFWRFPGGSSSDFYFWDNKYGKYAKAYNGEDTAHMGEPAYLDFDHFMELCAKTGSEPILTLNYGLARYGSLQEAIDLAVGWIQYAKEKGYKIRYVEVGNENYGDWEGGSDKVPGKSRLTGEEYGQDVVAFVKALKKVDPQLKVGAVVVGDDGAGDWDGFRWWNKGVMSESGAAADFFVVHEYFLWPFSHPENNFIDPSYAKLLGGLDRIAKLKANLDDMQDRYLGKRLPVAFDEFNIINASPRQTIETVNLLFVAGALGEMASHGFATANIWDWKNGLDEKYRGDHGMLATGDPRVPESTPRPSYYAFALWKRAGGDALVAAQVQGSGLRAYASRYADGKAGWILINETEKPLDLTLAVKGYRGNGKINAWVARGWGYNDLRVRFNEKEGPAGGGGPFPLDDIMPYNLQAEGGIVRLSLPGSSVTGLVYY